MSDKKLKIILEAETGKLEAALNSIPKKIEQQAIPLTMLEQLEQKRINILEDQDILMQKIAAKYREVEESGLRGAAKLSTLTKNTKEWTSEAQELFDRYEKVKTQINSINLGIADSVRLTSAVANNLSGLNSALGMVQKTQAGYGKAGTITESVTTDTTGIGAALGVKQVVRDRISKFAGLVSGEDTTKPAISSSGAVSEALGMKEVRNLAREVEDAQAKVNAKLKVGSDELENHRRAYKSLVTHIGEVVGIYTVYNNLINLSKEALLSIPKAIIQQQQVQAPVFAIFGSKEGKENLDFVAQAAYKAGVGLQTAEEAYKRYATSAVLAGASQEDVNKSFQQFLEVGALLHLPEERMTSLFVALEQMYAKGVVQSEEIKKQLGNVLPAAVEVAAQAMKKSPAAFMEAMKKNEIAATEAVPKIAEAYRKILGGTDDSVFNTVADQLNANIERVKFQYTELAREVGNKTEVMLNNVTKNVRDSLISVREHLTAITNTAEVAGYVLGARVFVELIARLPQVISLMTGVTGVTTGALTAYTALYLKIQGLNLGYDEHLGIVVRYKDEQVSLNSYIEATVIPNLEAWIEKTKELSDLQTSWMPNIETLNKAVAAVDAFYNTLFSSDERIRKGGQAEIFKEEYQKTLDAIHFVQQGDNEATKQAVANAVELDEAYRLRGKTIQDVIEAIKNKTIESSKAVKIALSGARAEIEVPKPNLTPIKSEDIVDPKALRDSYKEINQDISTIQERAKAAATEEKNLLEQNIITFEEYYRRRKAAYDKNTPEGLPTDYTNELWAYRAAEQTAIQNKDLVKQNEYAEKIKQLEVQKQTELSNLDRQRTQNSYQNAQERLAIEIDYYKSIGDFSKAFEMEDKQRYGLLRNRLQEEVEFGNQASKTLLTYIDNMRELNALEERQKVARQDVQTGLNIYRDKLQQVQVLEQIGAISGIEAAYRTRDANEEVIKVKQQQIDLDQERLDKLRLQGEAESLAYKTLAEKIRGAKEELETFKLQSDTVAQYFQNIMTPAFSNAFSGFITGSMNAKEAFQNFVQGVIKSLADIAAQALAKQLFGLVLKAFSGSSASDADTYGGFLDALSSQANGGINNSMGVPNGTILTSPTIFPNAKPTPFASGGVLAGEAGPEAVLPLRRVNGKLGVINAGGAGGSGLTIGTIQINVTSREDSTSEEQAKQIGDALKSSLEIFVKDQLTKAKRPGNMYNQSQVVTTF